MKTDLISREALIKAVEDLYEYAELGEVLDVIKAAPTVELTETEIQEVLNKRCMSAVANEYLVALHGKRPQADNNAELFKQTFGIYATEVWSMSESQFLEWLNAEVTE